MDLINPTTYKWIEAYINRPTSTLLINSDDDSVTGIEIAEFIYRSISKKSNNLLYRLELKDKKSIGIEDIRDFQSNLSLKADSDAEYTRFSLIPNAERLTLEAQNALLKLTEELPDKTIVMLVVSNSEYILTTLMSRCFQINLLPVTRIQTIEYGVTHGIGEDVIKKSYIISEGNRSVFKNILVENDYSIEEIIKSAKKFITSSIFDRQTILTELNKKNLSVPEFIQALKLTARTGMRTASSVNAKKHWKSILSEVLITEKQLEQNVQTKLALLSLSVRI